MPTVKKAKKTSSKKTQAKATTKKTIAKKTAAKKTVAKKPVAKKPVKKTVTKKAVETKPAAKKPVKKTVTKKTVAKKPAAKKPVKKTVAKKAVAKKLAAKKPIKKTVAKKAVAKKPAAKKPVKKTVAKKAVAKKPAVKKTAKKAITKKVVAEKTRAKKAAPKKTVMKKMAAKKAVAEQAPSTEQTFPRVRKLSRLTIKRVMPVKESATPTPEGSNVVDLGQVKPVVETDLSGTSTAVGMESMGIEPYRLAPDESYMNESQREHFRQLLLKWKYSLMEEVDHTVSHLRDEATNTLADPNDRATREETFSLELRTRNREGKLLKKIEEALDKIKNEEYGYCDMCGVEIGIRRLEARPTATLCIDCKTLDEIKERQQKGT